MLKVSKEMGGLIQQLCDIALRQGGLQNKPGVDRILSSMKVIEKEPKKEGKK